MQTIQTEVLVIGGGATGAGVLRDLALRGFRAVLVEKGDLTHGTTGRYHGLLHSGGRYVVKDPQAAVECIQENRILRRIMPFCIEDTGGFFVATPWDDPEYAPRFVTGCQQAGIPVEEISISQMLQEEPLLNPQISRCFRVPDASADSFLGTDANAEAARRLGAQVLTYHQIVQLLVEETGQGRRVAGALCQDLVKDEEITILADFVVNSSGAWAGQIAGTVGIPVQIIPGKGTMVAINHRILNTVVNRCKMPSDGDIIVPAHTVAVVGTTDVPVTDPDHYAIEPWEVNLMLEEGDKLVPGLKEMRILRAWAGVRPLYKESAVSDTRDVTRAFVLLDHEQRDGVSGLVTITSGKWTTYRKMAEVTVDLVCAKLGVQRPCTTDQEPLPAPGHAGYHHLGARLAKVEQANAFGELICECELATRQDVERAILEGNAQTIDDIRRDVRLGMGPCQGGFCTFRTAGLLQSLRHPPVQETNAVLRDFLQERWKGLMPILWGQQLRQERLDELIYLSVLNTDHAPGPRASRLKPVLYESPLKAEEPDTRVQASPAPAAPRQAVVSPAGAQLDVLVIGAGLGGLAAGWQACNAGARTRVIAKGWGSLYWNAGCIDVLGYYPLEQEEPVQSPAQALATLIQREPQHPYARAGLDGIVEAIEAFQQLCDRAGYPLPGSLDKNWLLPTALGTFRPTCLAPESMVAGDKSRKGRVLIVGFEHFPDFYPALIAENLSAQGLPSAGLLLDLPLLRQRTFVTGRVLAWMFEQEEGRASVTEAIRLELAKLKPGQSPERVGFPAVLGLNHPHQVWQDMQERLGVPVFEIPTVPPSIPGIRLNTVLIIAIEQAGGRVFDGMQAVAAQSDEAGVTNLLTEAAARQKSNRAKAYVLATGGILGGGVRAAYQGQVREMIFDLPLSAPDSRAAWLQPHFLAPASHPIYRSGVEVDTDFHPLDAAGKVVYPNLYAAGNTLAHAEAIRERSIEGIALATGYLAGLKCARETVTKGHAL